MLPAKVDWVPLRNAGIDASSSLKKKVLFVSLQWEGGMKADAAADRFEFLKHRPWVGSGRGKEPCSQMGKSTLRGRVIELISKSCPLMFFSFRLASCKGYGADGPWGMAFDGANESGCCVTFSERSGSCHMLWGPCVRGSQGSRQPSAHRFLSLPLQEWVSVNFEMAVVRPRWEGCQVLYWDAGGPREAPGLLKFH